MVVIITPCVYYTTPYDYYLYMFVYDGTVQCSSMKLTELGTYVVIDLINQVGNLFNSQVNYG